MNIFILTVSDVSEINNCTERYTKQSDETAPQCQINLNLNMRKHVAVIFTSVIS